MKNPLENCRIVYARDVREGDTVCFRMPSANYTVESIETDNLGNVRHRFNDDTASSSYHPKELLYVRIK